MASDGEITAMRAGGVPSRKVIFPVLFFATIAMLTTATASLWLTPFSTWKTYKILNQLVAAELTAEVQPRVFEEQFPNRIVYVGDVTTRSTLSSASRHSPAMQSCLRRSNLVIANESCVIGCLYKWKIGRSFCGRHSRVSVNSLILSHG